MPNYPQASTQRNSGSQTRASKLDPATTGVSVLQEDPAHKRSSLIRWEVTGTEIGIGESSRDKGNVELSAEQQ